MYSNVAFLHNNLSEVVDHSQPLIVTSCGHYRFHSRPPASIERPNGRKDYQLLYIAKGRARFIFNGQEHIVTEGNMILYRPDEVQHYIYHSEDRTEVYWVHFTGNDVDNILTQYRMPQTENVFYTGTSPDYQWLYRQMIQELQLRRTDFDVVLSLLLRHIFVMINRYVKEGRKAESDVQNEMERAAHYFHEHYHEPIQIEEYAKSRHMSISWFIRNFREILKVTPMQFILSLRMANAQSLLENTNYSIAEIAEAVGYDNPLYFSRLFRKHVGVPPTVYRKACLQQQSDQ